MRLVFCVRSLKQIVADQALDIRALKELFLKTSKVQGQAFSGLLCKEEPWAERKMGLSAG
jgi:hypothetical protein